MCYLHQTAGMPARFTVIMVLYEACLLVSDAWVKHCICFHLLTNAAYIITASSLSSPQVRQLEEDKAAREGRGKSESKSQALSHYCFVISRAGS